MAVYEDNAVVRIKITPSGVDSKTGSGVDAATVRVSLVPYGYEGDFAISDATAIIVAADASAPSDPESPPPPDENVNTVYRANFIGEGLLRKNKASSEAFLRINTLLTSRFSSRLVTHQ